MQIALEEKWMVTIFSSGLTLAMGMMFEANCLSSVATDVRRDPAILNSPWNTRVCRQMPSARRFFVVNWMSKRENDHFQRANNSSVVLLERRNETRWWWFCFVANEFLVESFSLGFPQESAFSPANNRAEKWWGVVSWLRLATSLEELRLQVGLCLASRTIHSPIRLYAHSVSVSCRMTRLSMHMHAGARCRKSKFATQPGGFSCFVRYSNDLKVCPYEILISPMSKTRKRLNFYGVYEFLSCATIIPLSGKKIAEARYFFESKKI